MPLERCLPVHELPGLSEDEINVCMQNQNSMSFSRRDTASGRCEKRSDEESLLLSKGSLCRAKPGPFADFTLGTFATLSVNSANVLRVT
jgi:hypothetical protein